MKLPEWLKSTIHLTIRNRWKNAFKDKSDYYIIWIGTQLSLGDDFQRFTNVYTFDLTILNFGLKITLIGNPPKTRESMQAIEGVLKRHGI